MSNTGKYERALELMKKWDSDEGATNEELIELKSCLADVVIQINESLRNRLEEESDKI